MKTLFLIFCLCLSVNVFAKAKVLVVRGDVTFGGQKVKPNSILRGEGEFIVGKQSYVRFRLEDSGSIIAFGYLTRVKMNVSKKKELPVLELASGYVRWLTGADGKKNTGGIKTKNVTMGVRGTDFYASYDENLVETEIVCYDGGVQLDVSSKEPIVSRLVTKNQWGGIGGRFGENLRVLDLPKATVDFMSNMMPIQ